jgi:outer membrane immunogenic protein
MNIALKCLAVCLLLSRAATVAQADPIAPIWSGVYVGAHAGMAFGTDTLSDAFGHSMPIDTRGPAAGLHLGYNFPSANVIMGIEGDASWSSADGSKRYKDAQDEVRFKFVNNSLVSLRGRIGLPFQSMLVYATGGIAWTEIEFTTSSASAGYPTVSVSNTATAVGYVVGGGVEAHIAPQLSARVEGLYYGFGNTSLPLSLGGQVLNLNAARDATVIRGGLSYHLN